LRFTFEAFEIKILEIIISFLKEVSDAILAAIGINDNRNCGDQFCCGFDLAQTIRLQLARLCWRSHWRFDRSTLLGVVETQGLSGEVGGMSEILRDMPKKR